jgi:hypothetical protein
MCFKTFVADLPVVGEIGTQLIVEECYQPPRRMDWGDSVSQLGINPSVCDRRVSLRARVPLQQRHGSGCNAGPG